MSETITVVLARHDQAMRHLANAMREIHTVLNSMDARLASIEDKLGIDPLTHEGERA